MLLLLVVAIVVNIAPEVLSIMMMMTRTIVMIAYMTDRRLIGYVLSRSAY